MDLTLHVWRQTEPRRRRGSIVRYEVKDVNEHISFLEMLDVLNEQLIERGRGADRLRPRLPRGHLRLLRLHDQRRGARPAAGDDRLPAPHAPLQGRRRALPRALARARPSRCVKDLVVDRSAFDRIIQAGGFISVTTGSAPEANLIPVPKPLADRAFDAAACIGCGACVAAVPERRGAALHRGQGLAPRPPAAGPARALRPRARAWSRRWRRRASAACTNYGECEAVCPKEISIDFIARMNRDYLKAKLRGVAPRRE